MCTLLVSTIALFWIMTPFANTAPLGVEELLAKLESRHWLSAVDELETIGESAVPALLETLEAGHGRRAARACEALARIGGAEATAAVLAATEHPEPRIRRDAVWAARHLAQPATQTILQRIIRADSDARTRRNALSSLASLGGDGAVTALMGALHDEVELVRSTAAEELARFPSPEAASALARCLDDSAFVMRQKASRALLTLGPLALPRLAQALQSPHVESRRLAVWVAARLADGSGHELVEQAANDPHWMVRNEVAAAHARRAEFAGVLWPETTIDRARIPSPHVLPDSRTVITCYTLDGRWAVVPASPSDPALLARQTSIDRADFPELAASGLHDQERLSTTAIITGRSLAEITVLGRPGGLSTDGFMAADEDILSVLSGDDRLVRTMHLSHPELAAPLMQVWNMVLADASARRWNMAVHRWQQFDHLRYNGKTLRVTAGDTKGGQLSVFDDGLEGAFWIEIEYSLDHDERQFLRTHYDHLTDEQLELLVRRLTHLLTGELQPHYIQRYGFYEGHTPWRTDPIAIAFAFGLRSLEELEDAFPGQLHRVLTEHHTRE